MADLSNLKISETYGRVLQKDPDTSELQNLLGAIPTSIKFNGTTLQYVDGNQQNNYVLISDAQGNASWGENTGGGGSDVYWSADTAALPKPYIRTSGNTTGVKVGAVLEVSGDTILGSGLGVTGNTEVKGSISADTGVYSHDIFTSFITTTASSTDTLVIESDKVNIKSFGGGQEYFEVRDDLFRFYFDGEEGVSFSGPNHEASQYVFNSGSQDIDFKISGPSSYSTFHVTAASQRIRIRDHLAIGANSSISHTDVVKYGLAVTGSSLFYPGTANTNCINAVGPISADTITGETSISTYGTIYSANTDLLDIFQVASGTPQTSYFTADTTPSDTVKYIRASGNTTSVKIGGDLELTGHTFIGSTPLDSAHAPRILTIDTESKKVQYQTFASLTAKTGDLFWSADTTSLPATYIRTSGNTTGVKIGGNLDVSGNTVVDGSITASGTSASPNSTIKLVADTGEKLVQLTRVGTGANAVRGQIKILDNDTTEVLFTAADDVAAYINNSGAALAIGQTEISEPHTNLYVTGGGIITGGLGVSGDTEVTGTLSADTMSGRTLTLKDNLGVSGETFLSRNLDMGDNQITNLDTPTNLADAATKAYVDGQYAYQYITFVGNVGALSDDNWQIPGNQGISNHTWNQSGGADGTTTGSTTLSVTRTLQHGYIRVPAGAKLVGVEGAIRSNIDDRAYAGLFTVLPDYEGPDSVTATLRVLARTPSSSNNVTNDPQSFKSIAAPADIHTFADGEMIIPALRRDSTSTQTLIGSFTIILKTPITT